MNSARSSFENKSNPPNARRLSKLKNIGQSKDNDDSDGQLTGRQSSNGDDSMTTITVSTPRKKVEEEDDFIEELGADAGVLSHVGAFLAKQGKAFMKNFIDYGPPYAEIPFDVALVNECAKPRLNHFEIHNLLNKRLNPNIPAPDDLYYTPIHWCARNSHYTGLKMMKRAGANFNLTTELGNTPLDLAVMMKHPPDRRPYQVKCVRFLLEQHVLVNTRDKGGFGPIDHAAANQDLELIELLLEYGAKLRRENNILVAKRFSVLKNVHDPACYKILYEHLLQEEKDYRRDLLKHEKSQQEVQHVKNVEKLHEQLNKRKLKKEARLQTLLTSQKQDVLLQQRNSKIQKEMEENLAVKLYTESNLEGQWKRDSINDHWILQIRKPISITSEEIYRKNRAMINKFQEENKLEHYDRKWRESTHGGQVEVPWMRSKIFDQLDQLMEEDDSYKKRKGTKSRPSSTASSRNGEEQSSLAGGGVSTITFSIPEDRSIDIDFRDENDDELDGEDLDDFIKDLQSIK
jgi:hypothetical protein